MKARMLLLTLLALTAPEAGAVVTGRTIVQSYERIMRSHLSQIAPEKRHEVAKHWLAPDSDPFRPAPDDSSDANFSEALSLMSQAAATLEESDRSTIPGRLRARLQKVLKQLDASEKRARAADKPERRATSRSPFKIYRPVPHMSSLAVSEDGRWIAFGESVGRTVTILEFKSQALVKVFQFDDVPTSLRFSPDGRYLAVSSYGSQKGRFEIFETTGWKSVLKDTDGAQESPVFLKDPDRVVEWGRLRNRVFDLTSKKANRSPPVLADLYLVHQVVAPDGSWFSGMDYESKRIEIFSNDGKRLPGFLPGVDAGEGSVYLAAPEGKTLIRVYENWVDFHDVASGRFLSQRSLDLNEKALGMAVDRLGKLLFVSERNGAVHVYRIERDGSGPKVRRVAALVAPRRQQLNPKDLILSPDEKQLIVKASEKIVTFDLETLRKRGELE